MINYRQKIEELIQSQASDEAKLQALVNLMPSLKPIDNSDALELLCIQGILYSEKLNRPEMEAQFYITRAKVFIMRPGDKIRDMKNITLAPNWFGFALESQKKHYFELDQQVKTFWANSQLDIEKSLEQVRKMPYAGAVGYCYKTIGEIYGQFYLQLRLYNFRSKTSFRAKLANMYFFRWTRLDDFLVLDKATRKKLSAMRKNCLERLHAAVKLFKSKTNFDYMADAYIALAVEHEGFMNSIRSKFYLWRAERLIKRYNIDGLKSNLALWKRKRRRPPADSV